MPFGLSLGLSIGTSLGVRLSLSGTTDSDASTFHPATSIVLSGTVDSDASTFDAGESAALSGTTDSDGSTFALDPNQVSGVALWLRADVVTITGSGVSTATDQSGAGNDATQGTDGSRMLVVTDTDGKTAVGENANAGPKALALPAGFYNFWKNTSGQPFTVIAKARRVGTISTANVELIAWGATNYSPIRFLAGATGSHYGHFFSSTGTGSWTDTQDNAWHSLVTTFTGTSSRFYQDGAEDASSPITITAAACGASASINARNSFWRDIAVFQSVLSPGYTLAIRNGQTLRWG